MSERPAPSAPVSALDVERLTFLRGAASEQLWRTGRPMDRPADYQFVEAVTQALPDLLAAVEERDRLREKLRIEAANNGELAWENDDLRKKTGFDRLRSRDRILTEIEKMANNDSGDGHANSICTCWGCSAANVLAEARHRADEKEDAPRE